MSWLDEYYPKGMKVVALNPVNEMQDGEIINHTEYFGVTNGIIVRFDDGSLCDYATSYLDKNGNYSNSYVQKRGN